MFDQHIEYHYYKCFLLDIFCKYIRPHDKGGYRKVHYTYPCSMAATFRQNLQNNPPLGGEGAKISQKNMDFKD